MMDEFIHTEYNLTMIANVLGGPGKISDAKVKEMTGKSSEEWYKILDDWGGKEKGYYLMMRYIRDEFGLNHWWTNAVVIRYEYERGTRR